MTISEFRGCILSALVGGCLVLVSACSSQQVVRNSLNTAALSLAVMEFEERYQRTSGLLLAFKSQFSAAEWQSIIAIEQSTNDIYRSASRLLSAKGDKQLKTFTALINATRELHFYYRQAYTQLKPRVGSFPVALQQELIGFHRQVKYLQQSYHNLTRNQSDEAQQIIRILQIAANGLVVFGVRDEINHSSRH